eukprot:368339-Amorphochlora_amoeboformis.AAC.1
MAYYVGHWRRDTVIDVCCCVDFDGVFWRHGRGVGCVDKDRDRKNDLLRLFSDGSWSSDFDPQQFRFTLL